MDDFIKARVTETFEMDFEYVDKTKVCIYLHKGQVWYVEESDNEGCYLIRRDIVKFDINKKEFHSRFEVLK